MLRVQNLGGSDPYAAIEALTIAPSPTLGANVPLGGYRAFPSDNAWNWDVSQAPVDPMSAAILQHIGLNTPLHPDFGTVWAGTPAGIPYNVVSGDQPKVPIHYRSLRRYSDPGPFPIPANAVIEGGPNGIWDHHVLRARQGQSDSLRALLAFPNPDGSWNADGGAKFDLKSNALRPDGWGSADAAGLPILPGLVRYDEVYGLGEIDHALRFTVAQTRAAHVYPATGNTGSFDRPDLAPDGHARFDSAPTTTSAPSRHPSA